MLFFEEREKTKNAAIEECDPVPKISSCPLDAAGAKI